ncbi:MAG: EthD domain-containing protein [Novosphingobium sp.]|nr:EthD domain-containing protein [Novosphingobium sp.]
MADKAYKILLFMKRRPGMSIEDFRDYYENRHVPLCMKYTQGISRYVRRYIEPQRHAESGTNEELPYDVITELWFDDEETWKGTVDYISNNVMTDEVVNDEKNLFDRPTMRMATVVECDTEMAPTG